MSVDDFNKRQPKTDNLTALLSYNFDSSYFRPKYWQRIGAICLWHIIGIDYRVGS
jgi:hypothetical protein